MPQGETKKQMGGWPTCFGLREGGSTYKSSHKNRENNNNNNKPPQKNQIQEEEDDEEGGAKQVKKKKKMSSSSGSGKLNSSSSELDLDRPNIEDYLPSGSSIQQEPHGKLRL